VRLRSESEYVMRPAAGRRPLLGHEETVTLEMGKVLPDCDRCQLHRAGQLSDTAAPAPLQEREDLRFGTNHTWIRFIAAGYN
jgi:hypothetical protein